MIVRRKMTVGEQRKAEERLRRAESRIPFYTSKQMNRLPAEPGMTILENLVVLELLLEEELEDIPESVRRKLMELYGVTASEGKNARTLLQPEQIPGPLCFFPGQKFRSGEMCFETMYDETVMPGKLQKVFLEEEGKFKEIEELQHNNPLAAYPFGKKPEPGSCMYLLFDGAIPSGDRPLILAVTANPLFPRNPAKKKEFPVFAEIRWSCYTREGYQEIRHEDDTGGFLISGEVRLWMDGIHPAATKIGTYEGYVLRCELVWERYDVNPRIAGIDGPLLEVWERDTLGTVCTARAGERLRIPSIFPEETYTWIYEKEGTSYISVTEEHLENVQKAVCMCKKLALQKTLGIIYGYDNQEFDVSRLGRILPGSLELMAVEKDRKNGQTRVTFFPQKEDAETETPLLFVYDEEKSVIRITDPGDYTGCELSIAGCALYHGREGNLLKGNYFVRAGGSEEELYCNRCPGQGGQNPDTWKEMCQILREEQRKPYTAVTTKDYEILVKEIPGLCIQNVRVYSEEDGTVVVAVQPYSEKKTTNLPAGYFRQIRNYLEEKRLLGTRIEIRGWHDTPDKMQKE